MNEYCMDALRLAAEGSMLGCAKKIDGACETQK